MLLEMLSNKLLLTPEYITTISDTASKRYKHYKIPKNDGKSREIYHPSKELKAIQRCLHDNLLSNMPVHVCAYAYDKGNNILKHATVHKDNNYLLKIDLKDFFPSISGNDIEHFCVNNANMLPCGWSCKDTILLINLTCRYGKLAIGAVTSPVISNIICYDLDSKIKSFCDASEVTYSRYADDLYFSVNEKDVLLGVYDKAHKVLDALPCPYGLRINHNKTTHTSSKHRRVVTGLVLTSDCKVSIGRKKKRYIKSMIHKWNLLAEEEKVSLKGLLSYVNGVEPSFINALCRKYKAKAITDILKYQSH